jgi:hypothetical protein
MDRRTWCPLCVPRLCTPGKQRVNCLHEGGSRTAEAGWHAFSWPLSSQALVTQSFASFQACAAKQRRTALFWVITQRVVVIAYDVSGQPIGPTFKNPNRRILDSWPLKTEPIGCPETSVRNYHYTLRNNPGDCSPNLKADEDLRLSRWRW